MTFGPIKGGKLRIVKIHKVIWEEEIQKSLYEKTEFSGVSLATRTCNAFPHLSGIVRHFKHSVNTCTLFLMVI